jgi:hypothetical protein
MFDATGNHLAQAIRVACGFPFTASRSGVTGETHAETASADGSFEILVSPELAQPDEVFIELLAQLCHTTAGAAGFGTPYIINAQAMGLIAAGTVSAPWKRAIAGADCDTRWGPIIESLGDYPHAALAVGRRVKQTTNLLKAVCPQCGYTVRVTNKWVNLGLPNCSIDNNQFILA